MKLPKYKTKIRGKYLKMPVKALNVVEVTKDDHSLRNGKQAHHKVITANAWLSGNYDPSASFRDEFLTMGFKLLRLYPMYYQGWECDQWGAIGEKDGKLYRLETSHGSPIVKRYTGARYKL